MATVIRLEGLAMTAGSKDIRKFFNGLHIPEGGVHITGGSLGEAFIIFSNEKDGKLALGRSGGLLKGSLVLLYTSSREELHQKMSSTLNKFKSSETGLEREALEFSTSCKTDPAAALLLSLVSAFVELQEKRVKSPPDDISHGSSSTSCQLVRPVEPPHTKQVMPNACYLSLRGLPKSVTRQEICRFFKGLQVKEIIYNVTVNESCGCLVKFSSEQDACEGLRSNGNNLGPYCVEVSKATEEAWFSAFKRCKKSSSKGQRNASTAVVEKRSPVDCWQPRSPKRFRSSSSSPGKEYCVMVQNLSPRTTKTEIKELFMCRHITNDKVLHLLDKWRQRTSTAFIIFDRLEDYSSAMNLSGRTFFSRAVSVSAVTKVDMMEMLKTNNVFPARDVDVARDGAEETTTEMSPVEPRNALTHIYARNLPADVRKMEIRDFFYRFPVSEDCITLLHNNLGMGIGEAVVKFKSEELAKMAESLHGQNFLGCNVLLTRITRQQMEVLFYRNH